MNLDRIQIVKGWVDHTGERHERIYDVAVSDGRTIGENGRATRDVGNTVNVGFEGALGEVVVQALDIAGVSVSTGAACTSGSGTPSPTLLALGLSEERARESVRFSLGPDNTESEVEVVLELLPKITARARAFR